MEIKGVVSVLLFIFLRCHLGSALNCYVCSGNCENNTTKTCDQGEQCLTLEAYSQDGKLQDRRMTCMNSHFCGNNGSSLLVQKCCDKDMCNDPRAVSETPAKPAVVADVSRDSPLQCYSCGFNCLQMSQITCQAQEVCVTQSTTDATDKKYKRGCVNSTACDKETPDTLDGRSISVMNNCCKTNQCNSAVHLEVPAVALLAAIVAAWISKR